MKIIKDSKYIKNIYLYNVYINIEENANLCPNF